MNEADRLLIVLTGILGIGIGSQWLAWRIRAPAILLLLSAGFVAGPLTGFVRPDEQFGVLLLPVVSLSVGLILFEGGLSLEFRELREAGRSILGLLTIGVIATWVAIWQAAQWLLGMPAPAAFLLGAILVVTGPTVIGPLLRDIRPMGRVRSIARWEGIVIDPIGACLAALVFQATESGLATHYRQAFLTAAAGLGITTAIGVGVGMAGALLMTSVLHRFWLTDHLQNPVSLMLALSAFTVAEVLHPQAGLVAATVMGIAMANQRQVDIRRIVEFKESLSVVLISCLFIVLAARVSPHALTALGLRGAAFVACLILVVRPVSVWLSTIGSGLSWREKVFLSWFAPRGIVAASVASVFAIEMGPEGETLASATLLVVFTTVAVYGLTAGFVARRLNLAVPRGEGVLIAGANPLARAIATALSGAGFPAVLVDSRYAGIREAHAAGLSAVYGDILSDRTLDRIDVSSLGRFLALTSNDDVNTLASTMLRDVFGREHVYQLARSVQQDSGRSSEIPHFGGRTLFGSNYLYEQLDEAIYRGAAVKVTPLTAEFKFSAFVEHYGPRAWPLFVIDGGKLIVVTVDAPYQPVEGQSVVSLVLNQTGQP
ncbi:MAG TPA: sodium:proton antiporter [Planctomycetaceae bacterium]|jgi:NhaP-type Na+/H+ or K+/H+ antiporter|nr:sodium:proton antiporter [Planctomycetaceae bacterium]